MVKVTLKIPYDEMVGAGNKSGIIYKQIVKISQNKLQCEVENKFGMFEIKLDHHEIGKIILTKNRQ